MLVHVSGMFLPFLPSLGWFYISFRFQLMHDHICLIKEAFCDPLGEGQVYLLNTARYPTDLYKNTQHTLMLTVF